METFIIILQTFTELVGVLSSIHFAIKFIIQKNIFNQLYNALRGSYSPITKAELKYLLKQYIQQKFEINGKEISIKELFKLINHSENDLFVITGKAASGKSMAMRHLYYRLARKHKCVYFQMLSIKDMNGFKEYLKMQKMTNGIKDGERVIAFFDGIDEAISFIQIEDFQSMFLNGLQSKINQVFNDKNLILEGIVMSFRPEFLEKSIKDLDFQQGKATLKVFQIKKMPSKDIIKIFRSLKILRKMEKKEKIKRHENRYPPKKEEKKYINQLKQMLKVNPDSIFFSPMYIRYAYAFMKTYEKQIIGVTSENEESSEFDILINAVLKWEFHIYYQKSVSNYDELWKDFKERMKKCMNDIVKVMKNDYKIYRGDLEKILKEHSLKAVDGIDMLVVITHCFMWCDENGQIFQFCHYTLYEYFLANYLFQQADFNTRKQKLLSKKASMDFLRMYYGIFCGDIQLNTMISRSISGLAGKILSINDCLEMDEKTIIEIVDEPCVTLLEIYEYLPIINNFIYRNRTFTQEQLEKIMDSGIMNLQNTRWECIRYANALLPCKYVEELILHGLALKDIENIENYWNLKKIDLRINGVCMYSVLNAIRNLSLECIYIFTEDGTICETINNMIEKKELNINNIFVDLPNYCNGYLKIYQLKQQADEIGQRFRFYIKKRTNLEKAKVEYRKSNSQKNIQVLEAIFYLEADEKGMLGLDKDDAEATLWNGIALAEYYCEKNRLEKDESAYYIFNKLEPFISGRDDELVYTFGKTFGEELIAENDYDKAKQWLMVACQLAKKSFKDNIIYLELLIYRARLKSWENDLEKYDQDLKEEIEMLPNYEENWEYLYYLDLHEILLFHKWKKGTTLLESFKEKNKKYCILAKRYAQKKGSYEYLLTAVYHRLVYANRMEKEGAKQLLVKYKDFMLKESEYCSKSKKWTNWMQYQEQKIYYFLVREKKENVIKLINKINEYKHATRWDTEEIYVHIFEMCNNIGTERGVDKHFLWDRIWF